MRRTMEQYLLPKGLDFEHLRICLDNYVAEELFICDCGGWNPDGIMKVNKNLAGKTLDYQKNSSGLYFLVDGEEVFHFSSRGIGTRKRLGSTLAYERTQPAEDEIGRLVMLGLDIDPYDPHFPEPKRSVLRYGLDDHLLEIFFAGRIHLQFHSKKGPFEFWTIVPPEKAHRE